MAPKRKSRADLLFTANFSKQALSSFGVTLKLPLKTKQRGRLGEEKGEGLAFFSASRLNSEEPKSLLAT